MTQKDTPMRTPDTETMTAPLPPLQEFVDRCGRGTAWMRELIELEMQSYAKLAVREALQRLLDQKTYEFTPSRIRAMIEEYK